MVLGLRTWIHDWRWYYRDLRHTVRWQQEFLGSFSRDVDRHSMLLRRVISRRRHLNRVHTGWERREAETSLVIRQHRDWRALHNYPRVGNANASAPRFAHPPLESSHRLCIRERRAADA